MLALVLAASVAAPSLILNTSGRLLDSEDKPVSSQVTIAFTVCDSPASGNRLWTDTFPVTPADGFYALELGDTTVVGHEQKALTSDLFAGDRWLEVTVEGIALSPRLRIGSVPAATWANAAGAVQSNGFSVALDAQGKWPASALEIPPNLATVGDDGKLAASEVPGNLATLDAGGRLVAGELPGNVPTVGSDGKLGADVLPSTVVQTSGGLIPASVLPSIDASLLTGTIPASTLSGTYGRPLTFTNPSNVLAGDGSGLTGVDAAELGGQPAARYALSSDVQAGYVAQSGGNASVSGTFTAGEFFGDGSNLTGVNAATVGGANSAQLWKKGDVLQLAAGSSLPSGCGAGQGAGLTFFDSTNGRFYGCDGSGWSALGATPSYRDGSSQTLAASSCKAILEEGASHGDGAYWIDTDGAGPLGAVHVWCDMTTEGGGWTLAVVNHVGADATAFYKGWTTYKAGFGDLSALGAQQVGWIGNDNLHELTRNLDATLRVVTNHRTYRYPGFYVMDEASKYRMFAPNSDQNWQNSQSGLHYANGMQFTTYDNDNDRYSGNCANNEHSGWWYNQCWYTQWGDQSSSQTYWDEPDAPQDVFATIEFWIR